MKCLQLMKANIEKHHPKKTKSKNIQMNSLRFQLTIDTDSAFISKSPQGNKTRVTLTNLDEESLKQLAKSIEDANLSGKLIELLNTKSV